MRYSLVVSIRLSSGVLGLVAAICLAACSGTGVRPVEPLPAPVLPSWIASISPLRHAQSLAQVRVIFAQPVAALGDLTGDGPSSLLSHFSIAPALPGKFVLFTPRMVGFVSERALPVGMRVRVTLSSGLRDLGGDVLAHDLSWTFATAPLAFSNLPTVARDAYGNIPPPTSLTPLLSVTASAKVDPADLAAHAHLLGGGSTIGLTIAPLPTPSQSPAPDASTNGWSYVLTPRTPLSKDTEYTLRIDPGVVPVGGNVPTTIAASGTFRTYGPLEAVSSPATGGRFAGGDPGFTFSNPLDPKSVPGNVKLVPAPSYAPVAAVVPYDATSLTIDPYALAPDTTYAMTLGAGLTDTFGQRLGRDETYTIRTGDFRPGFWVPNGLNIFPAGTSAVMNAYATNAGDSFTMFLGSVTPGELAQTDGIPPYSFPNQSRWRSVAIPHAKRNEQTVVPMALQALVGGSTGTVAYGFSNAAAPDGPISGMLQLTDLGIFAQTFPTRTVVMVQSLSGGTPVAGAAITVYRTGDNVAAGVCATGTTDASGEYDVTGPALESCYAGTRESDVAPQVMVVARRAADWSYVKVFPWGGIYDFDLGDASWTGGAPISRGSIFSDRQMYQPGEHARVTGIAYYVRGAAVVADPNATYALTMTDPSGKTTSLGRVRTDGFGVFSTALAFAPSQPLGYYQLTAVGSNGNTFSGSVRVAEFKTPNFKLDVKLDAQSAVAGSSIAASATASYLFGAPLDGGRATINVTRAPANLAPAGWDDYSFGRQWFWPENQPEVDSDVLQTAASFDSTGKLQTRVSVPADLPFPMIYTVDVQATDASNLSVDNSQSFTALASDATIGLKSDLVGQAGSPLAVSAIVATAAGTVVPGRAIHLELQKMSYAAATQLVDGGDDARYAVSYQTVDSVDATIGRTPAVLTLHPKTPGPYRLRANFSGSNNDASATDLPVFVAGNGDVDWGAQDASIAKVQLDKKHYRVGDLATALVETPYPRSDIYFSIVRQDVLSKTLVHASGNAVKFSFRVTPEMLPNVALEALVVRHGPAPRSAKSGALDGLARVGIVELHVDLDARYLHVKLTPGSPTVTPGGRQSIAVAVVDASGQPAPGEAVVMVVNDAILQLTGYRPPDLVKQIFADQPISTRFADSRSSLVLGVATPPTEKGWGYGGGFLGGAGSTRVRANFQPMAYYAVVPTDARGRANVAFSLPDDLTTWRVMAVALARDDAHFGNGETTFIASQPLLTNPLLPQFARPGDRIDAGVSLLDSTTSGTATVTTTLTGALSFATGDARHARGSVGVGPQLSALRFPMVVGTPAPTTVAFASTLGASRDAFQVPLTIRDRQVTQAEIDSGVATGTTAIPVDLSRGGRLELSMANSPLAGSSPIFMRALDNDPLPFVDDAASRLTILTALGSRDGRAAAIATIAKAQRDDGGFGWFVGARVSDPFETATAVQALAYAGSNGRTLSGAALARAKNYLASTLANPSRYGWCKDPRCKARLRFEMLWTLDALGDRRSDFLGDIVAQRASFDQATQIRLARYLLRLPDWRRAGVGQAESLEQTLYRTGRYANASSDEPFGSPVDAQAQMLSLLVDTKADAATQDGAVAALLAQRCRCGWPTIDQTAQASQALAYYGATQRPVPFVAKVAAGSLPARTVRFGEVPVATTIRFDAASLRGTKQIVVTAGSGMLHYTLLYTYPVAANSPGTLAGLRVTRTLTTPSESTPVATMDLAPLSSEVSVAAGDVFDVGVRVIVDHPVDDVVIEDPIPAGMEAVDASFATSGTAVVAKTDAWQIDDQEIYADRVMAFASHLEPGVYAFHYLVRSVTPGTYSWPGATATLRFAPEQFGRTAAATITIR